MREKRTQNSQNHCYFVDYTHIINEPDVERIMAYRAKQPAHNGGNVQFPPEADGEFDTVSVKEIQAWKAKLNERFGIGQGRLTVVEDVHSAG